MKKTVHLYAVAAVVLFTLYGLWAGLSPMDRLQTMCVAPAHASEQVGTEDDRTTDHTFFHADKRYRLGVVLKFFGNPYYQEMARGMFSAAEANGLSIVFQAGATESDQEGQRAVMEEMVARGYDAILFTPQTDTNLLTAVESARDKGIFLLNVDEALTPAADCYVGPDHYQTGVLAGRVLMELLPQGREIALIKGNENNSGSQRRSQGLQDAIATSKLRIVAAPYCYNDLQIALQTARRILAEHAGVAGFFCDSDTMALGVAEAVRMEGLSEKIAVLGREGIAHALAMIRNGSMTGTISTEPFELGRTAVEVAVRVLEGHDVESTVTTPSRLVTGDSMPQPQSGSAQRASGPEEQTLFDSSAEEDT